MKILAIGNSFSTDATAYLHQIAESAGIEMDITNLYIGGCSLERHWKNIGTDTAGYLKEVNGVSTETYTSIKAALHLQKWNIVTLQQASHESTDYKNYQPYLDKIQHFLRAEVPYSELVVHQTWAYEEHSERLTQMMQYTTAAEMYTAVESSYQRMAADLGGSRIIPSGKTFHELQKQGSSGLYRDTFHASIPKGRYILGAVWYEILTGNPITDTTFCPKNLPPKEYTALKTQIHNILQPPQTNQPPS